MSLRQFPKCWPNGSKPFWCIFSFNASQFGSMLDQAECKERKTEASTSTQQQKHHTPSVAVDGKNDVIAPEMQSGMHRKQWATCLFLIP